MKKIGKIALLLGVMFFAVSKTNAQISVGISVGIAPPELPVYVQPACPADDYLWQPGYWAYDPNDGYYWVPGVWVAPPDPGLYWTPCYWGYDGGRYGFHMGYWGASVGFYGGINYGYGYGGWGYGGGSWSGGHFRYNTAVTRVNTTVVHNTYINRTVINNTYVNNHTSFNGPGGVTARPRPEEMAAMKERHVQPTSQQMSHQQNASKDKSQFASVNHGRPAAAAMDKVGGHPYSAQGHVARTSSLGHANPTSKRTATNVNRPATHANRTTTTRVNRPATTEAHTTSRVNHPATNVNRPATHVNRTTTRVSRPANVPNPERQQPARQTQARQQPARQQPARQQQARPQQPRPQPQNNPRPAEPREKHR